MILNKPRLLQCANTKSAYPTSTITTTTTPINATTTTTTTAGSHYQQIISRNNSGDMSSPSALAATSGSRRSGTSVSILRSSSRCKTRSSLSSLSLSSSLSLFSPPSPSALLLPLQCQRRFETTGEDHSFTPGPITRALRSLFTTLTPTALRQRVATKLEHNMEQVERLEKEASWMRRHGSPLQVMGLPAHVEYAEVRARYRDLIFETHPDTATSSSSRTSSSISSSTTTRPSSSSSAPASASSRDDTSSSGSQAAAVIVRRTHESDYEILQTAFRMATNADSLFHRDNNAPALLDDLYALGIVKGSRLRRSSHITLFALMSYGIGILMATIAIVVAMRQGWEQAFRFFDPEFYKYMVTREKEEKELEEAGFVVDRDPKSHMPTSVSKIMFPGRFLHGSSSSKSSSSNSGSE